MLDKAEDYEFIDTSEVGDYITGDVYPVRKNRGDGSHQLIRYEDLLFLQEAYYERQEAVIHPLPSSSQKQYPPPCRFLDGTDFDNATGYLAQHFFNCDHSRFFAQDCSLPEERLVRVSPLSSVRDFFVLSDTVRARPSEYDEMVAEDAYYLRQDHIARAFSIVGDNQSSLDGGGAFNLLVEPPVSVESDRAYRYTTVHTPLSDDGQTPGATNSETVVQFSSANLIHLSYEYSDLLRMGGVAHWDSPVSLSPVWLTPYVTSNFFLLRIVVYPDRDIYADESSEVYVYRTAETPRQDPVRRGVVDFSPLYTDLVGTIIGGTGLRDVRTGFSEFRGTHGSFRLLSCILVARCEFPATSPSTIQNS